jgi:hypothetical protein
MSNAGHFVERDDGVRMLTQHIPSSFVNPNTELYINAGAAIDLDILFNEIKCLEDLGYDIKNRLIIHPNANVITKKDKDLESKLIKSGSTFKGCGASIARKVMRTKGMKLAKDYDELQQFIQGTADWTTYRLNEEIAKGAKVIIEGSQGVDLDLNHAEFPFCTSRSTIPQQLVADAGIPFQAVTNIIANIRTNPIRINNQSAANDKETCYTGNYWDGAEISWEVVAKRAGYNYDEFVEKYGKSLLTSVTKKIRRVFEFPINRMKFCHAIIGGLMPNNNILYSLNFVNFIDKNVDGVKTEKELMTSKVKNWLNINLYPIIGKSALKWVRTGPKHSEIVEL